MKKYEIHNMDCIAAMRNMPDNSVDSIVTDPPYELGFMGKAWDASGIANSVEMWAEALRVLKPGGHLLAFSGSRTYHRMTCAVEDAGFEVRDQIMWVYGSGFPKSLDVSKAIDKARDDSAEGIAVGVWLKAQREARGLKQKEVAALWPSATGGLTGCVANWETLGKVPKWDQWLMLKNKIGFGDEMDAEVWRLNGRKGTPGEAWQTADVLAVDVRMNEPAGIVGVGQGKRVEVERQIKASNSDAARQWEGWGTALKPAHEPICVARKPLIGTVAANVLAHGTGAINVADSRIGGDAGRWPANLIHDGSDEVLAAFPDAGGAQGVVTGKEPSTSTRNNLGLYGQRAELVPRIETDRSAARFFYCAKTSKADRGANIHPTVKPTDLMAYLVRLVTPPGGLVLDPFMGSGSTGKACMREGFQFIGIDMTPEYVEIARQRIEHEHAKVTAAARAAQELAAQPQQLELLGGA